MVLHGMAWEGMAWDGMAWSDRVWSGLVWHGMVRCGVVWFACMYVPHHCRIVDIDVSVSSYVVKRYQMNSQAWRNFGFQGSCLGNGEIPSVTQT